MFTQMSLTLTNLFAIYSIASRDEDKNIFYAQVECIESHFSHSTVVLLTAARVANA